MKAGRSGQRECNYSLYIHFQCVKCECVRARWRFKISDGRNIIPRIWRAAKTASMRFFLFLCFSVCIFLPCSPMDAYAWWAAEGRPEHCIIGGRPKAALHKKYKYSVYACLSMDTVCMLSALLFYGCRCLVGGRRPPRALQKWWAAEGRPAEKVLTI